MDLGNFIEELRRRLLTDEPDHAIRADIRDLVIALLEDPEQSLTYWAKDHLSRAISALKGNAADPGTGSAHPRLRLALLLCEFSRVDESDRDGDHPHPYEIIEALTRPMLLEAALQIP